MACSVPPAAPGDGPAAAARPATLPRPAALHAQGVPDIPASLPATVAKYTEFAGHGLADWHPRARSLLVSHRPEGGRVSQLWRVAAPMAAPEKLTDGADPVSGAQYEPGGRYIVLARSAGGNEVYQLYRMDLPSRQLTQLTDNDHRHSMNTWLRGGSVLIGTSVPLDRTAQGGRRVSADTTLWRMDPERPTERQVIATLPGAGWFGGTVSRDDKQLALTRYLSANESEVWLLDLATGQRRRVAPAPSETLRAVHWPVDFSPAGDTLYLLSDRASEFRELMRLNLASGQMARLGPAVPWDLERASLSADGRHIATRVNADGREELRIIDTTTGQALPLPPLPPGSVVQADCHPSRPEVAFAVSNAQGPSQLYTLDLAERTVTPWTRARLHPALDVKGLTEQQVVRWTSFDGRSISGLVNRPPARFAGKRPVLINIHGGPEGQAQVGFAGRNNHLLQELGIAIIQPNVRGSTGYGKTFLALDNGKLREDSVKDIGALLDWIATQPDLDASRVVVAGGSYGGYMSLAVATHYADRIAGTVDVVGISHFVTFLESTETYRRDLRRVEYGDERDPRDARPPAPHLAADQRAQDHQTAVRGAGPKRPARAGDRGRADRGQGAGQRQPGVVPGGRQRRPRLCPQGKRRLPVLRHGDVPAAGAEAGCLRPVAEQPLPKASVHAKSVPEGPPVQKPAAANAGPPKSAPQRAMERLGLARDIDLALHLPLRWEDETQITAIAAARDGQAVQVEGTVRDTHLEQRPRRQLVWHAGGQQRPPDAALHPLLSQPPKDPGPRRPGACAGRGAARLFRPRDGASGVQGGG